MTDADDANPVELFLWYKALCGVLASADHSYKEAKDRETQQAAVAYTLNRLIDFLRDLPGLKEHTCGLSDLAHALDDLMIGKHPQLLQSYVDGKGGRALSVRDGTDLRGRAVAFTEVLMDSGIPEKVASKLVAEWLAEAGFMGTRKRNPVTQSTVRYWRKHLDSGDEDEDRLHATQLKNETIDLLSGKFGHWPPETEDETNELFCVLKAAVGKPATVKPKM